MSIPTVDKIKGFFLLMWRNVTKTDRVGGFLSNTRKSLDSVKAKGGDLNICGSSLFNGLVTDMWRADEYRDYLDVQESPMEHGKVILNRMMSETKSDRVRRPAVVAMFESILWLSLRQSLLFLSFSSNP